jgi:hypothetical protein
MVVVVLGRERGPKVALLAITEEDGPASGFAIPSSGKDEFDAGLAVDKWEVVREFHFVLMVEFSNLGESVCPHRRADLLVICLASVSRCPIEAVRVTTKEHRFCRLV